MNCYLPDESTRTPGTTFSLRVTIDGEAHMLPDLRKRVVYLGASLDDLQWTHRGHDKLQFADELKKRLVDRHVPEPSHAAWLSNWTSRPSFLQTVEAVEDQQILVELLESGGRSDATPLYSEKLKVENTWVGRINTVFLEVACPE